MGGTFCGHIRKERRTIYLNRTNSTAEHFDILDDDFEAEITEAVDEYMVSITEAYCTERDRILDEMRRSAPMPYHGLLFTDYPHKNKQMINEMARKKVTSNEAKQQISDEINEMVEPSFKSQTADWDSKSQKLARSCIKAFIENLVNETIDHLSFD